MLPQGLIQTAVGQSVQVELKTGERYTGTLEQTDTWMNVILREVTIVAQEGDKDCRQSNMAYLRGNNIKFLIFLPSTLEKAKAQQERDIAARRKQREQRDAQDRNDGGDGGQRGGRGGRGRGRGRGGRGGGGRGGGGGGS